MSSQQFNDKHLLWWILKAIDACGPSGPNRAVLLGEPIWKEIGAPDWVLPALEEKYQDLGDISPMPGRVRLDID